MLKSHSVLHWNQLYLYQVIDLCCSGDTFITRWDYMDTEQERKKHLDFKKTFKALNFSISLNYCIILSIHLHTGGYVLMLMWLRHRCHLQWKVACTNKWERFWERFICTIKNQSNVIIYRRNKCALSRKVNLNTYSPCPSFPFSVNVTSYGRLFSCFVPTFPPKSKALKFIHILCNSCITYVFWKSMITWPMSWW